jgi:hypothetical protein
MAPMTTELIGYYERLLEAEPILVEAVCITVVEGCGPNQALELMGADPATVADRTVAEAARLPFQCDRQPAVAAAVPGGAVVLEPNGFQGTRPEVLRALAAGGGSRCTTIFWNANAGPEITHARDGRLSWTFDPLCYPDTAWGPAVELAHRAAAGLPFDDEDEDWRTLAFVLLERETGFRLDAEWLAAPHLSALIVNLAQDILAPENADHPALTEPEIAAILADPSSVDRRRIDVIAAERAVRVTGVDQPAVTEALRLLRANESVPAELIDALRRLVDDLNHRRRTEESAPGEPVWSSPAGELHRRTEAVLAVLGAAGVMPFYACTHADLAVIAVAKSFPGDSLVISVMGRLRALAR